MRKIQVPLAVGALLGLAFWLIVVFATNVTALVLLPVSVVFTATAGITNVNLWLVGMGQMIYFAMIALALDFLIKSRLKFKRLLLVLFALLLVFVHTLVYYQARLNQINEVAAEAFVDGLANFSKEQHPAIFGNANTPEITDKMSKTAP